MDGAAVLPFARLQDTPKRVQAAVRRQQGRMDVQKASLPLPDEVTVKDPHEARERDEPRAASFEDRGEPAPVFGTVHDRIALENGVRYAYTGNIVDRDGDTTFCPGCGVAAVIRNWFDILCYQLDDVGRCTSCGYQIAGVYEGPVGTWGRRRQPLRLLADA